MFAQAEHFNILHNYQLVVILMKYSTIDNVPQILFIAFREEHHGFCVALRCAIKSFSIRVFADTLQHSSYGTRKLLQALLLLLWS